MRRHVVHFGSTQTICFPRKFNEMLERKKREKKVSWLIFSLVPPQRGRPSHGRGRSGLSLDQLGLISGTPLNAGADNKAFHGQSSLSPARETFDSDTWNDRSENVVEFCSFSYKRLTFANELEEEVMNVSCFSYVVPPATCVRATCELYSGECELASSAGA